MTITRGHGKEIDAMIEQAFRRGYYQGFHNGMELPAHKHKAAHVKIHAWRYAKDDKDSPPPGSGQGEPI